MNLMELMLLGVRRPKSEDRSRKTEVDTNMIKNTTMKSQVQDYYVQFKVQPEIDFKVFRKTSDFRLLTSDNLDFPTKLTVDLKIKRLPYSNRSGCPVAASTALHTKPLVSIDFFRLVINSMGT